jgi:hypothetical protein
LNHSFCLVSISQSVEIGFTGFLLLAHPDRIWTGGWVVKVLPFQRKTISNAYLVTNRARWLLRKFPFRNSMTPCEKAARLVQAQAR